MNRRTRYLAYIVAVVLIVGAATVVGVMKRRALQSGGPRNVDAATLLRDYREDVDHADVLYRGKPLVVFGVVNALYFEQPGLPYVTLADQNRPLIYSVECHFRPGAEAQVKRLKPGDRVKFQGVGGGKSTTVRVDDVVILDVISVDGT